MRTILLGLLLLSAFTTALADVSYPVNIQDWKGRTYYLDTDTNHITDIPKDWPKIDPDNYSCPVCGINPGWPVNIVPLRLLDAPVLPTYDSNLFSLNLSNVICGPDSNNLDARCEGQTNVVKPIYTTTIRSSEEQKQSAKNEAAYQVLLQMPEAEFRLHVLMQLGLLMQKARNGTLSAKWQAVDDAHYNWILNHILPIWDRRKALLNSIDAGTITGGEIESGWPNINPAELPE